MLIKRTKFNSEININLLGPCFSFFDTVPARLAQSVKSSHLKNTVHLKNAVHLHYTQELTS